MNFAAVIPYFKHSAVVFVFLRHCLYSGVSSRSSAEYSNSIILLLSLKLLQSYFKLLVIMVGCYGWLLLLIAIVG